MAKESDLLLAKINSSKMKTTIIKRKTLKDDGD